MQAHVMSLGIVKGHVSNTGSRLDNVNVINTKSRLDNVNVINTKSRLDNVNVISVVILTFNWLLVFWSLWKYLVEELGN